MTIPRPFRSPKLQITIPGSAAEISPAQIHTRQLILKSHEAAPFTTSTTTVSQKKTMSKARFLRQSPRAQSLGLSPRSNGSETPFRSYRQLWSTNDPSTTTPLRNDDSHKENKAPKAKASTSILEKTKAPLTTPTPQAFALSQKSIKTDISFFGSQRMVSQTEKPTNCKSTSTKIARKPKMRQSFKAIIEHEKKNNPMNDSFIKNNKQSAHCHERPPLTQFASHATTLPKDFSLKLLPEGNSSCSSTNLPPKKELSKAEQQAVMDRLRKSPRLRSKKFLVKMACHTARSNIDSIVVNKNNNQDSKSSVSLEKPSHGTNHRTAEKSKAVVAEKLIDVSTLAPRQWTHNQLTSWLSTRLISLWKNKKRAQVTVHKLPSHVHGRAMMRMTKAQIANALQVDATTGEYVYSRLRSETDRADRMALKKRAALKKEQEQATLLASAE